MKRDLVTIVGRIVGVTIGLCFAALILAGTVAAVLWLGGHHG